MAYLLYIVFFRRIEEPNLPGEEAGQEIITGFPRLDPAPIFDPPVPVALATYQKQVARVAISLIYLVRKSQLIVGPWVV